MEAIDMLLNDLESEILKAKKATFSNTDIVVNRKQLLDLVSRIRQSLPQVIQDAMRITRDQNEIIASANAYAQTAMENADARLQNAVDENEVSKKAEERANQIVGKAQEEYNRIIIDARNHSYTLLASAEQQLAHLLDVVHESMNNLSQ